MDEEFKICPGCGAEFYAHIESCHQCEVKLVFPGEEAEAVAEEPAGVGEIDPNEKIVVVEQGPIQRVSDIAVVFEESGIPYKVAEVDDSCSDDGCSTSSCGPATYVLFVPASREDVARNTVEAYWQSEHPEIGIVRERESKGQCPGCGFTLSSLAPECPECGLNLSGGGGGGGGHC